MSKLQVIVNNSPDVIHHSKIGDNDICLLGIKTNVGYRICFVSHGNFVYAYAMHDIKLNWWDGKDYSTIASVLAEFGDYKIYKFSNTRELFAWCTDGQD